MRLFLASAILLLSSITFASPNQIDAAMDALRSPQTLLIDVRSAEEFAAGAVDGAEHIGHEQIAEQISTLAPDKDTPIVLYCQSGRRSGIALQSLRAQGYTQVINAGGYEQLKEALEQQD